MRAVSELPFVDGRRRARGRRARAAGFTLVELLIVIAIIAVIAALAIPGLLRARISGNEASAIASLRAISTAQATFSRSCSDGLYAKQLDTLGTAPSGQQPFLSPDLSGSSTVMKSGYVFSLDGTAASREQVVAAMGEAKRYAVAANEFQRCVSDYVAAKKTEATKGGAPLTPSQIIIENHRILVSQRAVQTAAAQARVAINAFNSYGSDCPD